MKCPDCADVEKQRRLGPVDGQPDQTGYRCDLCGRLYVATSNAATSVVVKKSGISDTLTVQDKLAGAELRQWLKNQGCRVGPIFEPAAGRFTFFVYARRETTVDLIGQHGGFRVAG